MDEYELINDIFLLLEEYDFMMKNSVQDIRDGIVYLVIYSNPCFNFDIAFNQKTLKIKLIKNNNKGEAYIWKNINGESFINQFDNILLGEQRVQKITQLKYNKSLI